ncbi:LPS-assembly protein LptD [Cognatishimia activa]|uniref:LPS-assembly protein LptD n=1 Tax=Cognatishimia activa TaxID=1715691 RepID=A0A0P1IUD2_9RHOB|nr:LPS assembly protein LptD [Cognatishimia activa]CUJ31900.1 Organic solvent tolerance protein [Cognatishimia activa]CUK27165.1 Organic solvent tolerance protein [Cognatishimia activa]
MTGLTARISARNRAWLAAISIATLTATMTVPAQAQDQRDEQVILVADSVFLQANNLLTATGNIEAFYGDTKLTASKIIYDGATDTISIEGPIELTGPDGFQVFASMAELDADLKNGLIKSARLVLNEQLEVRAQEMRRVNGRRSELHKATATSCKTCENGEPPLWQIRAKKVTHDQDEQQLYFDQAQFRVFDVPIFYVPRLRLPDPTLERATGFLIPSIRARSRLGTGIRIPYFIAIGDHKDLTLTPYIATNTRTLEWGYRQAFRNGDISFEGAISKDDFSGYDSRAYVFGSGQFDLKRDYKLSFQIQRVSDASYLPDYDYSSQDRLSSDITISRVNRSENTQLSITNFETIRTGEDNETIPSWVVSARKQKRFSPALIGGEALWELEAHSHYRISSADTVGRDVNRVNAAIDWRKNWVFGSGLELGTQAGMALDVIDTHQDSTVSDRSYMELTPSTSVTLRYPWIKRAGNGATYVVEPIAQVGWSGGTLRAGSPNTIANDESTRVEFDEGNLLSLSRFPSDDRREHGFVAAWGLNWSRFAEDWSTHLTFGQVVRDETHPDFTASSGLQSTTSDFLVAAKFENASGLQFSTRALIDGIEGLNKAEARGGWHNDKLALDATYIWLDGDLEEDRPNDLSEWNFDGSYRMGQHWTGLANWRYDVASRATAEAGVGVQYRNECVKAKFEVSRRFTSSSAVQPATDYSFLVEILGFSSKTIDKTYARTCN